MRPRTEATDDTTLITTVGEIHGRWVVNAAGLGLGLPRRQIWP